MQNVANEKAAPLSQVVVVDYGVGNIGALLNMLEHLGISAVFSGDPKVIADAERILLPGVGAFDKAMSELRRRSLIDSLTEAAVVRRRPLLGICLGMQLLAVSSEEGHENGLGWIDAQVKRIDVTGYASLKVPHVGWAQVRSLRKSSLFDFPAQNSRFYFVHSYHMSCGDRGDVAAVVDYGVPLCCSVAKGNIFGVQFHPEKSHRFGMEILSRFCSLDVTR